MLLVNGERRETLSVSDRGLQYGDGLFETIEIKDCRPVFFDLHLKRLEAGCLRLGLPFPSSGLLAEEAGTLCRESPAQAVLKIIVTAGSGGRGYRRPEAIETARILSLHPFPDYPATFGTEGIRARICAIRLGINPALAGLKHLNRLEQVLARAEWSDPAIQEGLMLDSAGHLIEGTMSNLFYVRNGALYTASLEQCGIAGIIRELIIRLATRHRFAVTELSYTFEQLASADEIFVCNSIIGIWPVRQIEQIALRSGPITREIQQWLADYKQETLRSEP
ncbi:aminodeoxychorismate lyase [Candidatus Methylomicrobium oryzae]|uniref:aminodeoxychorismate lyase n=1 Tax=Candidatus Methylomicrobium oryzae TaxID=2802053 RepID=UPI0019207387|nr:aminodeoxychorismate lyase [Methylomicrobium sp. RS1]MBL1263857.1 aminodeoxychorismate lyase [Methylomicrobium sp. RS1]